MDARSGEATVSNLFWLPSEKGFTAPIGSKFIPYRVDLFSEGARCQEGKQKITKVPAFIQNGGNRPLL